MFFSRVNKVNIHSNISLQSFFPKPISLEILDEILNRAIRQSASLLKNAGIVYIHHPLKTSVNLVDAMIRLGTLPKNIFVLGKKYSECHEVVETIKKYGVYYQHCSTQARLGQFNYSFTHDINQLWKQVSYSLKQDKNIENLLILDHGGYASSFAPIPMLSQYRVVGVEKTTGGLIKMSEEGLPPFPIISMATCAAKKTLEPSLIAEVIINKLSPLILKKTELRYGIIGYGSIGKALASKLLAMGYNVKVYDHNKLLRPTSETIHTSNLSELIDYSDCILGCTGQNNIQAVDCLLKSKKDKILVSCSSEDKEFLLLLKIIQERNNVKIDNPLDEVQYTTPQGAILRILRGGFPINFDHSGESVPEKDIQLTRALVLGSILQATQFFNKSTLLDKAGIYKLDPIVQRFIATQWLKTQSSHRSTKHLDHFHSIEWILENSDGRYEPCFGLKDYIEEKHKPVF